MGLVTYVKVKTTQRLESGELEAHYCKWNTYALSKCQLYNYTQTLPEIELEGILPNSFYKAAITLLENQKKIL